jgi:hypothetical protein
MPDTAAYALCPKTKEIFIEVVVMTGGVAQSRGYVRARALGKASRFSYGFFRIEAHRR